MEEEDEKNKRVPTGRSIGCEGRERGREGVIEINSTHKHRSVIVRARSCLTFVFSITRFGIPISSGRCLQVMNSYFFLKGTFSSDFFVVPSLDFHNILQVSKREREREQQKTFEILVNKSGHDVLL